MVFEKSPSFSFKGWDIWKFVQGRKKTAVTIVAGILGYFISDSVAVATFSGGLVECIWAVCEYYVKSR